MITFIRRLLGLCVHEWGDWRLDTCNGQGYALRNCVKCREYQIFKLPK